MNFGERRCVIRSAGLSTRNRVGLSGSSSTWAWTMMKSDALYEVTNHFSPFRCHLPFFSTALVFTRRGSEPASGSVMAKPPRRSPPQEDRQNGVVGKRWAGGVAHGGRRDRIKK